MAPRPEDARREDTQPREIDPARRVPGADYRPSPPVEEIRNELKTDVGAGTDKYPLLNSLEKVSLDRIYDPWIENGPSGWLNGHYKAQGLSPVHSDAILDVWSDGDEEEGGQPQTETDLNQIAPYRLFTSGDAIVEVDEVAERNLTGEIYEILSTRLPERLGEAYDLAVRQGLTGREVAERMGTTEDAVDHLKQSAKEQLERWYEYGTYRQEVEQVMQEKDRGRYGPAFVASDQFKYFTSGERGRAPRTIHDARPDLNGAGCKIHHEARCALCDKHSPFEMISTYDKKSKRRGFTYSMGRLFTYGIKEIPTHGTLTIKVMGVDRVVIAGSIERVNGVTKTTILKLAKK